jgi:hypothetical protein
MKLRRRQPAPDTVFSPKHAGAAKRRAAGRSALSGRAIEVDAQFLSSDGLSRAG